MKRSIVNILMKVIGKLISWFSPNSSKETPGSSACIPDNFNRCRGYPEKLRFMINLETFDVDCVEPFMHRT